ncbi:hypothetical protein [Catenovulum sediminis]|uniref:Uncharacterized protein n=1 Tax=Catenovulum sediminis TaxID=1740262 RepID=A0ABV1RBL1_9ALTE
MATKSITVPHANYKIDASTDMQRLVALESIDQALTSIEFSLQMNDWKTWEPILEQDRLNEKKQERRYVKGNFEVFYGVLYQSNNLGYIRLSFYEHDKRQFSKEGIDLYYELKREFSDRGLVHLSESSDDIKASRPVVSPEEFNQKNPPPPFRENVKYAAFVALSFIIYGVVILFPGWLTLRRLTTYISKSIIKRRCILAGASALLLFPTPIPMSMFGPVLLVPGILVLPFVFGLPEQYINYVGLSVGLTLVISVVAAFWLIKSSPNKALHRTSR